VSYRSLDSTDPRLLLTRLLLLLLLPPPRAHSVQLAGICASVSTDAHGAPLLYWTLPIVGTAHSPGARSSLSIDSVQLDVRPECESTPVARSARPPLSRRLPARPTSLSAECPLVGVASRSGVTARHRRRVVRDNTPPVGCCRVAPASVRRLTSVSTSSYRDKNDDVLPQQRQQQHYEYL